MQEDNEDEEDIDEEEEDDQVMLIHSKIFPVTHSAHLLKKIQGALHELCMMVSFSIP